LAEAIKFLLILKPQIVMKLIIITPTDTIENEAEWIIRLFENGLQSLHLRKHTATKNELDTWLNNIPAIFHHRIVIHQQPEMLTEYNLGGFHLNQYHHHQKEEIKNKLQSHQTFSMSAHNFDEIKTADGFDYYFISPVFDSLSKQGLCAAFDKATIENGLKENADKKIFALGGVCAQNLNALKKMGFAGAATLGNIWLSKNPLTTFLEMKAKLEN
jgi:thiamine-phosphate pyrophosphorylase